MNAVSDDEALIESTLEKVNSKVEEKKTPREKRVMAVERKEKASENLRKGRETSLGNGKAKAAAKAAAKPQGVPAQPPVQVQPPVQAPVQVQPPAQVPAQAPVQADAFEPEKKEKVAHAEALDTPTPSTMKEPPSTKVAAPMKVPPPMKVPLPMKEAMQTQEEQDTGPHAVCTRGGGGGGLW